MDAPTHSGEPGAEQVAAAEAAFGELLRSEARCPFGPRFFYDQLAAFVRDRCPDPSEHLPRVDLWVHGALISVCHVIAIAPRWVAVAARSEHEDARMRAELIPYESIVRVTIVGAGPGVRSAGFDPERRPVVIEPTGASPEEALASAARPPRGSSPGG